MDVTPLLRMLAAAWLAALLGMGLTEAAQAETPSAVEPTFRLIDPQLLGDDEHVAGDGVRRVIPGQSNVFVIDPHGRLFGMGLNRRGSLGLGESITASRHLVPILDKPLRQVVSHGHSLIVTADGELWGMGTNIHGQLGLGDTTRRDQPERVLQADVIKAAAGQRFSLVLEAGGKLWVMGANAAEMAGIGKPESRGGASQFVEGRDSNRPVPLAEGVSDVAAHEGTGYFLKRDGSLWAVGLNKAEKRATKVSDGPIRLAAGASNALLFIKADGSLWSIGSGWTNVLGTGDEQDRTEPFQIETAGVVDVTVGGANALYLKQDGSVWGMGRNRRADLGLGHDRKVLRPQQLSIEGQPIDSGLDVWTASGHTLILNDNGQLWGTGDNYHRQLQRDPRYFNAPNRSLRRKYGLNDWPAVSVRLFADRQVGQAIGNAACTLIVDGNGELWTVGWHPTVSMTGGVYELPGDQRLESREARRLELPAASPQPPVD